MSSSFENKKTSQKNKCSQNEIYREGYTRKAYTRDDGTKVKVSIIKGGCIAKRGLGQVKRAVWETEQREKIEKNKLERLDILKNCQIKIL